jgi:protein SCO1/2
MAAPAESRRTLLLGSLALLVVLVAAVGGWLVMNGGPATDGLGIGGPFTLQGSDGRTVTDRDLHGRYVLMYFGYTFCPDVCPTTLSEVTTAMDKLGPKADQVQPVFVTVDPERDTPEVMGDYTAMFTPRLLGLTGTPEQIRAVAHAYRVYYQKHRTGDGPADYSMDHSSLLYLLGPDGRFIALIRADEPGEAIAADIAKHMS